MVTSSSLHPCQAADVSCLLFTNNYAATVTQPPFDAHPTFIPQFTPFTVNDIGSIGTATDALPSSTTTPASTVTQWIASIPRGGGSSSNSGDDSKHVKGESSTGRSTTSASTSIVEEILQSPDDYYHALGLEDRKHCSMTDIQKAYRRRAVQTHPDKTGGDRRAFDIVAKAYEVLSNDETRAIYDKFGTEGLTRGPTTHSFQDFFQSMFHPSSTPASSFARNRTVRYQLQVSLEDLYRGTTHDVWVTAPGKRHGKTVQVHIPRGTVAGQPIIMSGAMDFSSTKGVPPGDLIFVITPTPHPVFTRKNHDLAMELTLSLEEALCGFQRRTMTHLDGTTLEIASAVLPDGETPIMIASGDVQVLKGKGFPKGPHGDEYGDLYIQFRVELPKHQTTTSTHHPLTPDERQQLRHLLEKLQGKKSSDKDTKNNDNKGNNKKKSKRRKGKTTETIPTNNATSTDAENASPSSSFDGVTGRQQGVRQHRLQVGKASEFGRATGIAKIQKDDHEDGHHGGAADDHDDFLGQGGGFSFPFGSGTSTFFQHSARGPTRSFYFGNHHSFFGHPGGAADGSTQGMDDDGGIPPQCQQM